MVLIRTTALLWSVALLLLGALNANAQETSEVATGEAQQLLADQAGLIEELNAMAARFDTLEAGLDELSGEEYLIRLGQIGRREQESVELFDRMVDAFEVSRAAGVDTSLLERVFLEQFDSSADYILRLISESERELEKLALKKVSVRPRDLLDYEERFASYSQRIDRYFQLLIEHRDRLQRVNFDTGKIQRELAMRLPRRADELAGRIELASSQIGVFNARIAGGNDDSDTAYERQAAELKLEWATRSLNEVSDMLDGLGLPTADYRQLLIQTTGLTEDIFNPDVARGLLGDFAEDGLSWLRENGTRIVFRLFLFLLIVFAARLLGNFLGEVLRRGVQASSVRSSQALQNMLATVTSRTVLMLGVLFGISQVGIEVGPVLAAIGIIGFAVGFALQETLANFAAGTMLLAYRPFDTGDIIRTGDLMGTVHDLSMVNTTLLTFDNQQVLVPNNKIWGDVITNITAMDIRRIDISIQIAPDQNVQQVFDLLASVVSKHPHALMDPPPNIQVNGFAENAVEIIVRPWARREDYWETFWDLQGEIKIACEEAGIELAGSRRRLVMLDSAAHATAGLGR